MTIRGGKQMPFLKISMRLYKKMESCNISRFAKFYSAEQVRLIIEYLGEP